MWLFLKQLLKQNYSIIILAVGSFFVGVSSISLGENKYIQTHDPDPISLFILGVVLIITSIVIFIYDNRRQLNIGGLDLSIVKESRGIFSTKIYNCEVKIVKGRIEEYTHSSKSAIVLPCNEYFDDECTVDTRSALGAYVNNRFKDRCGEFASLVRERRHLAFGEGAEQQKTKAERAKSFGIGLCLLLDQPLGQGGTVALLSTTTQRAEEGLESSVSYLFEGMKNLFKSMADARLNEVVLPLLGSGHGGIDRPLAFIGLLMAVAEAAHRGYGGSRERTITIIIFRKDSKSPAEVDDVVIRRGLALIGSKQTLGKTGRLESKLRRRAA